MTSAALLYVCSVLGAESEQGWCGQDDRQQFNLVLWGTAATNSLIAEAS